MLKNYLKIAFRNLWRDKAFSFINILGLSLGMICVILILFYIMDELSYDKYFKDSERIHRIAIDIENSNKTKLTTAPVTGMLPQALAEYPQIEEVTRIIGNFARKTLVSVNADKQFYEDYFYWVDPNLYKVFNYKFLRGNSATALDAPLNMVVTREMAEKYFGTIDVLGKTLKTQGKEYQITGVVENLPPNTHFKLDFMASMLDIAEREWDKNWHATMFHTYVKLKPNSDTKQFESQIHDIAYKYVGEEIKNNGQKYRFFLQPLTSIHLHSHLEFELGKNNSYRQLQVLGVIALIILLIACFNFINIATARATRRAKEVGIRKTVGSGRWQLVGQFFMESLLMSTIALLIALVGVELLLPTFNQIADKELSFRFLAQPLLLFISIAIFLVITLLSGSYPALILSKFQPQEVLKGQLASGSGGQRLRNWLVTAQFSISIVLIVATITVSKQLHYMQQQDLGFKKEQMLVLRMNSDDLGNRFQVIKNELQQNAFVKSITASNVVPGQTFGNNLIVLEKDRNKKTNMFLGRLDESFFETYNIPLLAGRNFNSSVPADSTGDNVIINEAALPFFGWKTPEEALGATFGGGWGTVIGVMKDFHYTSLQTKIEPLLTWYSDRRLIYFTIKMNTNNYQAAMLQLQAQWKKLVPEMPFDYFFLDESFDTQYRSELRLSQLFTYFSGLAIFIACLGLLGLSAYVAERRTKEIGIRKVLGASTSNILLLLSKDFILRIGIAFLIAVPIALYVMNQWLTDFAYRINLQWWVFALAGLLALAIALFTISFQAVRAASANPVESLKNE